MEIAPKTLKLKTPATNLADVGDTIGVTADEELVQVDANEFSVKNGDLLLYRTSPDGKTRRLISAIARGHWHQIVLKTVDPP